MSRIAKAPVAIPSGVEVGIDGQAVLVRGPKGQLDLAVHDSVEVVVDGDALRCRPRNQASMAMAGTMRSLLNNMVVGVSAGFERRLQLVGVGYRAQMQGTTLNLALGYSHPIDMETPEGVQIETPTQTEIVVTGIDKQKVGQTAAVIRGYRPPEPYKGKGVKYSDEHIIRKEAKKK